MEERQDLISRQMAIDAVRGLYIQTPKINNDIVYDTAIDQAHDALINLPSAQPEPKTGHWIHKHERTPNTWECSNCGYRVNLMDGGIYKFCSACGEKKEGEG